VSTGQAAASSPPHLTRPIARSLARSTSAIISYDFDVAPAKRRDIPDFYGYVPDAAVQRMVVFNCMIMNGALLLLVRSTSTALLATKGQS
jgi:hypothetical protein